MVANEVFTLFGIVLYVSSDCFGRLGIPILYTRFLWIRESCVSVFSHWILPEMARIGLPTF